MNVSNERFDLNFFVSRTTSGSQKLTEPNVQAIEAKYHAIMKEKIDDPEIRKLFKNKVVTALFLDKIPTTSGSIHPDSELVRRYGYSSSTVNSMEVIRYLQKVRDHPLLTENTRKTIDSWIQTEREYLDIAVIFDGWRLANPNALRLLRGGTTYWSQLTAEDLCMQAPAEEIEILAEAIAQRVQKLQYGEGFKMLGGYNIHETRLWIRKGVNGFYEVFHYNTAGGKTLRKFGFTEDILGSTKFWKKFIYLKINKSSIDGMMKYLKKVSNEHNLEELDYLAPKSKQASDSCSGQAVEADLRHQLVRSTPFESEGLAQYKILKSLMAELALDLEKGEIEPTLYALLESKEQIKSRYLRWASIVKDEQKFEYLKKIYIDLITTLNSTEAIRREVETISHQVSKSMCLRDLDRKLNVLMKDASKAKIEQVKQQIEQSQMNKEGLILCLKHQQRIQKVGEMMEKTRRMMDSFYGRTLSYLRIGLDWLPPSRAKQVESYLRGGHLDKTKMRDTLKEYLAFAEPSESLPFVQALLAHRLLTSDDYEDLLRLIPDNSREAGS